MTKYARDEFDKVPETASRQGVHRAASAPVRRRLWPILTVGIAALAIGLVAFLIMPKLGFTQAGSEASTSLASTAAPDRRARPLWGTRNGILLAGAIVSSAVAWWMIAWPVATLSNIPVHRGHFALTFAHMVGGTGMLLLGGLTSILLRETTITHCTGRSAKPI